MRRWILVTSLGLACVAGLGGQTASVNPAAMRPIATVSPRFVSYNVEMAEVTGGSFWKPYGTKAAPAAAASTATPAGMDPNLYEYRPPVDLSNARLRKLAAALGPEYVRVSGTWANSVYFGEVRKAPAGFSSVLTPAQWKGVIDFVHAVHGDLVTSFATSPGTRNAEGVWTPKEAGRWLAYTKSIGGQIAATEFMNEPTYAAMGGAPKGYDAAMYGRDVKAFRAWLKRNSPGTLLVGPGSVGEGPIEIALGGMLHTSDLMTAAGPVFDVYSYHLYAAASQRCAALGPQAQTTAADALTPNWLGRAAKIDAFYSGLGAKFEPGKPVWITETADAACGGNPWASTFLDTFRYVNQHASLAQRGVKVIMHNTLASSDYGLLNPDTFEPRPNYWATLLWHRLMGTRVLDPKVEVAPNVYTYAQCEPEHPGGVTMLVINADRNKEFAVDVSQRAERYTLTAPRLESALVQLNGRALRLGTGDTLPALGGEPTPAGRVRFAPASITFLAMAGARNPACR